MHQLHLFRIFISSALLWVPAALHAQQDATQAPAISSSDSLEFKDCSIGDGSTVLQAECATLVVPLDWSNPGEESIELFVAKLSARTNHPQPDPLTLIAGGPGQSASDSFPAIAHAFRHIRRDRDILLLDQRGTGKSNRLDCPETNDEQQIEFDPEKISSLSRECLAAQQVDPRYFTTSIAVKDLEHLRKQLYIDQWNIYGVSYGTRVALHYLRRYPDSVRTLILDAVVPPGISLGPDVAIIAQQALDALFERCADDQGCAAAFPNIGSRTRELMARLATKPLHITYEDISSGQLNSIDFNDRHLAITLRLMTYSAFGGSILPSMLFDGVQNNNFAPLARQAELQARSIDDTLAVGMHNAIICTEDAPFIDKNINRTQLESTYLGAELLDALMLNCDIWPEGIRDDDFKTPVVSDVPTLVMSGGADPITPASYGDQVASSLSNSLHIVNQHQGHMQAPLGCISTLMAQLVSTADINSLELSCLSRLHSPPFFVDANGPLP